MAPPIKILSGQVKDLGGGFLVRRVLPDAALRAVGPFVFFDHFGPTQVSAQTDDVRPHPHIGLATVTYLIAGRIRHRDSLGTDAMIEPGAINWMTAGRGVVHSERWGELAQARTFELEGLQLWVALPQAAEELAPSFHHSAAADLPELALDGIRIRVLLGRAFGASSPVPTASETVYLDVALNAGASWELSPMTAEQAIYALRPGLAINGEPLAAGQMALLDPNAASHIHATSASRLVLIGGAALDAPRHMWWNFVSSRKDRIAQAAAAWQADAMGQVPGETERMPLPEFKPVA